MAPPQLCGDAVLSRAHTYTIHTYKYTCVRKSVVRIQFFLEFKHPDRPKTNNYYFSMKNITYIHTKRFLKVPRHGMMPTDCSIMHFRTREDHTWAFSDTVTMLTLDSTTSEESAWTKALLRMACTFVANSSFVMSSEMEKETCPEERSCSTLSKQPCAALRSKHVSPRNLRFENVQRDQIQGVWGTMVSGTRWNSEPGISASCRNSCTPWN